MAELILDGRAKTVDIAAFSLERFAEGKSLESVTKPLTSTTEPVAPEVAAVVGPA